MTKNKIKGSIMLLLTALIWGVAFVAQSDGMNYVGPFTYGASRYLIGGAALMPVIAVFGAGRRKRAEKEEAPLKTTFIGGICCGVVLFVAGSFQQFGVKYTTVGKAGFITALYIIIVPLIQFVLYRRSSLKLWLCTAAAIAGFYLLCINGDSGISSGDLLVLACALFFAMHIMVIDRFNSKSANGLIMSCIQFFTAGILSLICMFIFEKPAITDILAAWLPILYAGIMSSGVGYTMQILGQRHTDPTTATLIMSLESVFSALAGWVLLGEVLSIKELSGCALVFAAVVAAQIDIPSKKSGAPDKITERSGIRKDTGKEDEKRISE